MRGFLLVLTMVVVSGLSAQKVEVTGQLKIDSVAINEAASDVLFRNTDGIISKRNALSFADLNVSIIGDTLKINDKDFWIMPGISAANWAVDGSGNAYRLAKIGTQTWIRANLRTTKYNDGTPIPLVTDNTTWGALTTPAYCWYNNDSINFSNPRGALYNQYATNLGLTGGKNVCPVGYHIPTDAECNTLATFLGTNSGGKLKIKGTSYFSSPNSGAIDQYDFSGVSTGFRDPNSGGFSSSLGIWGEFWTQTLVISTISYKWRLTYNSTVFEQRTSDSGQGLPLRCLKD